MVTDLVEVERLGTAKTAENLDFRRFLMAHHHRRETFRVLAVQVQQQIDCTTCANCCRHSIVAVTEAEIESIARYLNSPVEDVRRQYTTPDPEKPGARILASDPGGCVFLDGNLCIIYEARPAACRDFPHVSLERNSLGGRFASLGRWAALCPIVYNALEEYKRLLGYHSHAHAAPGH